MNLNNILATILFYLLTIILSNIAIASDKTIVIRYGDLPLVSAEVTVQNLELESSNRDDINISQISHNIANLLVINLNKSSQLSVSCQKNNINNINKKYDYKIKLINNIATNKIQINITNNYTNKIILDYETNYNVEILVNNTRKIAHHISDICFEALTGIFGVFSHKIAYINVIANKDGSTIHQLRIADSDGHNDRLIKTSSSPMISISWSPDSTKLAYVCYKKSQAIIEIVDLVSGHITQLPYFRGLNNAPAFSPDGEKLAVVLSYNGSPNIYLYDFTTKQYMQLTYGSFIDTEPCWSPDNKNIYFTSNRSGKPQIFKVIIENKTINQITTIGDYNATPSISKNGNHIAFMHKTKDGKFGIATQNLTKNTLTVLTNSVFDQSPDIAPNNHLILYSAKHNLTQQMQAISIDGRVKLKLPIVANKIKSPKWSPL